MNGINITAEELERCLDLCCEQVIKAHAEGRLVRFLTSRSGACIHFDFAIEGEPEKLEPGTQLIDHQRMPECGLPGPHNVKDCRWFRAIEERITR